jgi:uncharacterized protein YjiS (DUF1127 family)
MSATFSLGNQSYINSSYEEQPAAAPAPSKRSVLTRLSEWRHRRQITAELSLMTDHELADIGLSRADLSRVLDPASGAARTRDRRYIVF